MHRIGSAKHYTMTITTPLPNVRRKRILLVDDHALFRAGLAMAAMENPLVLDVLQAPSVAAALLNAGQTIHLILLDHYMPGLTGINGIRSLKKNFPDSAIAIVSGSTDLQDVQLARENGADGFLFKTVQNRELQDALSALLRGQSWFPGVDGHREAPDAAPEARLTPKQLEVLAFLAEGLSNRAIGKRMDISENTIRSHVSALLQTLNVSSRASAIAAAHRLGLLQ